jgi:tRNA (guanine37-N1)-methyltransferase
MQSGGDMKKQMVVISVVTVFPELFTAWSAVSLLGRAQEAGLLKLNIIRLADFTLPKERIDTPACGPGAGMVLKAGVVAAAIDAAVVQYGDGPIIFLTPTGRLLTQRVCQEIMQPFMAASVVCGDDVSSAHMVVVCGRYEGVDSRVIDYYRGTQISVGNYIVMSGDVPAQLLIEALVRYVPGVVGDAESVERDSFSGSLIDFPAYGQPQEWRGLAVPPVLLSGNHAAIERWRTETALQQTVLNHFEWLRTSRLSVADRLAAQAIIPAHYVVLMHDQVLIGRKEAVPGTTSVTTIDVHDIARSCATYGVKKFYVVTPLKDQQELLRVFFEFWHTDQGKNYNENRYDAMQCVQVVSSLVDAEADIAILHDGLMPIKIATSARPVAGVASLGFDDQVGAWSSRRPVAVLFGTGQGMTEGLLKACDYVLTPVHGFTKYNHLSVRAAVAIILDRWLGYYEPK